VLQRPSPELREWVTFVLRTARGVAGVICLFELAIDHPEQLITHISHMF
jgi:hypothetical protein